MPIVRFDPFFRTVREFDRLAGDFLNDRTGPAPAYDIEELGEDRYAVAMAVPGFTQDEIEVTVKDRNLVIAGQPKETGEKVNYVRRGIAKAPFTRSFSLGEHVEITGAELQNGILRIELERRLPESAKPRRIAVTTGEGEAAAQTGPQLGEQKAA